MILKKKIVLASTSIYRAQLLGRLGLQFVLASPETSEVPLDGELPVETALRLAIAKALSLAPGSRESAIKQLERMRGQTLLFHTGIALLNTASANVQSRMVTTTVRFREFSGQDIENYLDREHALDCAGSAKSEGLGIALIASMQSDDPTALIGLPLIALIDMLQEEGISALS